MDRVRVNEDSSKVVEFDVLDENGAGVAVGALSEATLTLYDLDTHDFTVSPPDGVLNGRDRQNVLNANDVAIGAQGHVVWTMQPEDNVIETSRRQVERHRAMFDFRWSGTEFHYELEIEVVNLRRVA